MKKPIKLFSFALAAATAFAALSFAACGKDNNGGNNLYGGECHVEVPAEPAGLQAVTDADRRSELLLALAGDSNYDFCKGNLGEICTISEFRTYSELNDEVQGPATIQSTETVRKVSVKAYSDTYSYKPTDYDLEEDQAVNVEMAGMVTGTFMQRFEYNRDGVHYTIAMPTMGGTLATALEESIFTMGYSGSYSPYYTSISECKDLDEYFKTNKYPGDIQNDRTTNIKDFVIKANSAGSDIYISYTKQVVPDIGEEQVDKYIIVAHRGQGELKSQSQMIPQKIREKMRWPDVPTDSAVARSLKNGQAMAIAMFGDGPVESKRFKAILEISFRGKDTYSSYSAKTQLSLWGTSLNIPATAYADAVEKARLKAADEGCEIDETKFSVSLEIEYVNTNSDSWSFDNPQTIYGGYYYVGDYRLSYNIQNN